MRRRLLIHVAVQFGLLGIVVSPHAIFATQTKFDNDRLRCLTLSYLLLEKHVGAGWCFDSGGNKLKNLNKLQVIFALSRVVEGARDHLTEPALRLLRARQSLSLLDYILLILFLNQFVQCYLIAFFILGADFWQVVNIVHARDRFLLTKYLLLFELLDLEDNFWSALIE